MSYWTNLSTASALALIVATPSVADVTAAEVWADWQDYMTSYGLVPSAGSVTNTGGVLTITDFAVTMEMPEGNFSEKIDQIVMAEQGDGTVNITLSPTYPINMTFAGADETPVDVAMNVVNDNLLIVASGEAGNTTYDFTADRMTLESVEIINDDEKVDIDVELTMTALDGTYTLSGSDPRRVSQVLNIGGVTLAANGTEDASSFNVAMSIDDAKMNGAGTLMNMTATGDLGAALKDGADMAGGFTHGKVTYALDATDPEQSTKINGSATSGSLDFAMSAAGIGYGGTSQGNEIVVSGSQIPFPEVRVTMAESNFDLRMPIVETAEGATDDFAFGLGLTDFTISDQIWGMVDPAAMLPRDPATISLDLSGKVKLFLDLLDLENAENMEGLETPGELHALSINELVVSAVGAMLTGSGSFTFDNSDMTTFDGMPAPTGSVDMKIVGANGLIDTLSNMGLLPQEQVMGTRMMLGLFARPGNGPDTLTSTIEVKGDGSISANGQRIR